MLPPFDGGKLAGLMMTLLTGWLGTAAVVVVVAVVAVVAAAAAVVVVVAVVAVAAVAVAVVAAAVGGRCAELFALGSRICTRRELGRSDGGRCAAGKA